MKNKIIVSLILVATIFACMFAFVGCQTPATISSTNDGAQVVVEVGESADLPYTLNGELLSSQSITTTVKLGKDVIEIKDGKKVEAKKAGIALVEVTLLKNEAADSVLSIEILVKNSKAVKAAQDTISGIKLDSALSANADYSKAFEAAKKEWNAKLAECITDEQLQARTEEAQAALDVLNAFFAKKEDVIEALSVYTLAKANADLAARGYRAEEIEEKLNANEEALQAIVEKWQQAISEADCAAELSIIEAAMPNDFNTFVNDIEVRIMISNVIGDYDLADGEILEQLQNLSASLKEADAELKKQIDNLITTIKWQGTVLDQVSKTYTYDGSYHVANSSHPDYTVEYKNANGEWESNGVGFKDAGVYEIRLVNELELSEGTITVYAYSSVTILKGTLPTPIWPHTEKDAYVLYTPLKEIKLVDGVAGEGSVHDAEGNIYGSRVLGYFRWLEEERELDPDNYGAYSVELVPYLYDEHGDIVYDENGTPVRNENWEITRQLIRVNVKPAYVTVVPVEGQWKNYDGTTATNILFDIEVYEDAARTILITPSEKLENYIRNNLEGALVLEDVAGEPAKDAGNWLIERGTLQASMNAKFYVNYEGRGITYEIKPLVIDSLTIGEIKKYYDGTTYVRDINETLSIIGIKAYDSEGNLVDASIVDGETIDISVIGAQFEDKNVGEGKNILLDGATIVYTQNGAALKNYIVSADVEITFVGTIMARPITVLTGRIADRAYNGTDIADYTTEDATQRVIKIQNVDAMTGELVNSDAVLNTVITGTEDVYVELKANGRYLGENNTGKNVGINKSVLFNNSEELTAWVLAGEDAANYVYVGGLDDSDPDKTDKITYLGNITPLKAADVLKIVEMEASKTYDGKSVLLASELTKNSDGTYKATFKFLDVEGYEAISSDELFVSEVIDNDGNMYWDGVNPQANVGTWKIKIDDAATSMTIGGADAANYDWSDLIAEGTGVINPKTIRFDMNMLAEMNDRAYDTTNIAYAVARGTNGGIRNFDTDTGILTNVHFENLVAGDAFDIRILKDENNEYYNGLFADKNVESNKLAYWTNDSATGVMTWELVAIGDANVENYSFADVDLPVRGGITAIRIYTVKFALSSRIYDGSDVAAMDLLIGTVSEDETYVTVNPEIVTMEGAFESDDLYIEIYANGQYNDKNAAAEKEALFGNWKITGEDAGNYLFGTDYLLGELTPMTTVKGVGKVEQKKIEAITITGYSVDKSYNDNYLADYNDLNAKIAAGVAVVNFQGIIEGDDLSIILTANGQYGTMVDGVFTPAKEVGDDYLVRYTQKNATGADRNNYYIDSTDVYASGKIL